MKSHSLWCKVGLPNRNIIRASKASHKGNFTLCSSYVKKIKTSQVQWLTPVILATQEAEIRRVAV
jgi:uncharacterized protein (DUF305 family)